MGWSVERGNEIGLPRFPVRTTPDRRILATCFALAALASQGCGSIDKEIAALANQHRPAIERNLAAWPAIAAELRTRPPLTQEGIVGEPAFEVDAFADSGAKPVAALCYAEDLASPDELGYVWQRIDKTGALNQCASFLHRGHSAFDPANPDAKLRSLSLAETQARYPACANYRYLLVIRTLAFLAPSSPTSATKPFAPVKQPPEPPPVVASAPAPELLDPVVTSTHRQEIRYLFEGGLLRGEILAFELPGGKLLGGYRMSAQNGVRIDGDNASAEADLGRAIEKAVRQVLANRPRAIGGGTD